MSVSLTTFLQLFHLSHSCCLSITYLQNLISSVEDLLFLACQQLINQLIFLPGSPPILKIPGIAWNDEQEEILLLHMLDPNTVISRARAAEMVGRWDHIQIDR